jgi:hypothetical protein
MWDYTKFVATKDVASGALSHPGYLLDWIMEGNYPHLQAWMSAYLPERKKLAERSY